jgi:hypothetical protein
MLGVLAVVMLMSLSSCTQDDIVVPISIEESIVMNTSDKVVIEYLVNTFGFSANDICFIDDDIISAEGDILFSKSNILSDIETLNNDNGITTRVHRKANYLVTAMSNIVVNVGQISHTGWKTAVSQAASEWNALNGGITFQVIDNPNASSTIMVYLSPINDLTIVAEAPIPSNGYPGSFVRINSNTQNNYTSSQMKFAMAHELGHTIGFMHTDTSEGVKLWTYFSNCDSSIDAFSVMRPTIGNWSGFSMCDEQAFYTIY